MTRQVARRLLVENHFERMDDRQRHITRNLDRNGRPIRGTRITVAKRSDRRKMARALAAGEWRRRS